MRSPALALALAALTSACAQAPASQVIPGETSATGGVRSVVRAVGTPIYALGKGLFCVAGTIVSVPVVALGEISGHPQDEALGEQMIDGTGRACGGAYVLGQD